MRKNMILIILMIASLLMSACSSKESAAEGSDFPKRPIELVVPFGEGSASDTFARKFAEIMSKSMEKPLQPVNKDGSGGLVGMVYAHGQANDGYTVLEVTPSHVIADVLGKGKDMKFLEDFEPLARIQSDIYVLSVPENSEIKSFDDLVEIGKDKEISFAGVSPGGLDDLTLNALAEATGVKVKFIPYGSGSEVKAAVLGGEVDVYLDKLINTVGYIRDGKVTPLVVLNDERVAGVDELKDTPTTVEKGYDVTIGSWRGFVVKKDTPQEVKDYLLDQMKKAYETEEYKKFNAESLTDIREGFLGPEDFKTAMLEEYETFDKVAKQTGLKD
ncbi:tripartite tricarboxylate transporter substrate binding protein [Cytobacillus oceanisediminis]|uniref:Bug family tripartite tricarboxylate transporter substrate binding protein n=1 Tax=Cytobacillus oceanisediminis TaxID=665099 RepID=UPI001D155CF7|nr:tripartite tricarboxylate transporter substrate binding protein [Cytobacillus oceanisediminis]MCC3648486.1 tripartite tricarboxylate transporter substrate binding protein [Cytobacillus oceanisediminis]